MLAISGNENISFRINIIRGATCLVPYTTCTPIHKFWLILYTENEISPIYSNMGLC
jgi:hypothetical protein